MRDPIIRNYVGSKSRLGQPEQVEQPLLQPVSAGDTTTSTNDGYSAAAWMCIAVLILATLVGLVLGRPKRSGEDAHSGSLPAGA